MIAKVVYDNVTTVPALTAPLWLPYVQDISNGAGVMLPILGCIWVLIQIVGYFYTKGK